jgi:hypothetical protein
MASVKVREEGISRSEFGSRLGPNQPADDRNCCHGRPAADQSAGEDVRAATLMSNVDGSLRPSLARHRLGVTTVSATAACTAISPRLDFRYRGRADVSIGTWLSMRGPRRDILLGKPTPDLPTGAGRCRSEPEVAVSGGFSSRPADFTAVDDPNRSPFQTGPCDVGPYLQACGPCQHPGVIAA